ncbi:sugar phosphate isomerase/epimerase family protein [Methanolobus sp. WCC1]|uniref:sugar phosphate isomerase/epimerase family protein n=1 Tax=unclassified Methanolobus TaxID=2629569 RepID=UPI00324A1054
MNLSVSNIAWEPSELPEHLTLLKELGCNGVEISPSSIWDEPVQAFLSERKQLLKLIDDNGLEVSSLHSLTYNHPELKMFGPDEKIDELKDYLFRLIDLAHDLKSPVMVYGSPQSRRVSDGNYDECFDIAVDFFQDIGKKASSKDVYFCIEPLGPSDGCDFITNADEAYKLIEIVDSTHFCLHLDAKAMMDVKEDYQKVFTDYGSILKHFHVGDPGLRPPGTTTGEHLKIAEAIKNSVYDGFVSVEMKRGFGPSRDTIKTAVDYVRKTYL